MSAFFVDPAVLTRLIHAHVCIEFSQLARIACSPQLESGIVSRRACRKHVNAALQRTSVDRQCDSLSVRVWRPESNWAILWDSHVHAPPFPSEKIAETLVSNWAKSASAKPIDIYFNYTNRDVLTNIASSNPLQISALLIIVEYWWTLTAAGSLAAWNYSSGPLIYLHEESPLGPHLQLFLDSDMRFAYYKSKDCVTQNVLFVPTPRPGRGYRLESVLESLSSSCAERGYRYQILSPQLLDNGWPTLKLLPSIAHRCERI